MERPGIALPEILQGTVDLIPPAWQYPEITGARVTLDGQKFKTENFSETTAWQQTAVISVYGKPVGRVEVCYLEERPARYEGPFLKEERDLLDAIAEQLGKITEKARAEAALQKAHDELELRVEERTAELAQANQGLQAEIAQHQQTAATLLESEDRYRRLVEVAFEAIAIYSDGKIVHINPAGAKLLGACEPEELVGKPIRDVVHPEFWKVMQASTRQAKKERRGVRRVEERLIRLDGTYVDVEAAVIATTYQGQPAVQVVFSDLTARKRVEREQRRIARDLHDSLGHSLGYLHLKLDQLAASGTLGEVAGLRRELAHMRDVADEAYELVRGMLASLRPSSSTDLAAAMLLQARVIGDRGGFEVQVTTKGRPQRLDPILQQQILYLFQEALINVERHASAKQVQIEMSWTEDCLTAVMVDDGRGFEVDGWQSRGHYGLRIMQERADEMDGHLTFNSRSGAGTEIMLKCPLRQQ